MKTMLLGFCLGAMLIVVPIAYDAGKRGVVRDCLTFHTFTYARSAWFCTRMRTAIEREKEEKATEKAVDLVEL
jgi:hypothetical protein